MGWNIFRRFLHGTGLSLLAAVISGILWATLLFFTPALAGQIRSTFYSLAGAALPAGERLIAGLVSERDILVPLAAAGCLLFLLRAWVHTRAARSLAIAGLSLYLLGRVAGSAPARQVLERFSAVTTPETIGRFVRSSLGLCAGCGTIVLLFSLLRELIRRRPDRRLVASVCNGLASLGRELKSLFSLFLLLEEDHAAEELPEDPPQRPLRPDEYF